MAIFKRQPTMNDYRMPDETYPRCPHCESRIDGLMSRQIIADMGKAYAWACPQCQAVLGVTHRKGFFMG